MSRPSAITTIADRWQRQSSKAQQRLIAAASRGNNKHINRSQTIVAEAIQKPYSMQTHEVPENIKQESDSAQTLKRRMQIMREPLENDQADSLSDLL